MSVRVIHSIGRESDKVFCSDCGAECEKEKVTTGYDASTGEPYFKINARCPKRKFFSLRHQTIQYSIRGDRPPPPMPQAPRGGSGEVPGV